MEKKYFTVSTSCKIGGKQYMVGVCYALTSELVVPVEALKSQGLAQTYDKEIRMISGRPMPVGQMHRHPDRLIGSKRQAEGSGDAGTAALAPPVEAPSLPAPKSVKRRERQFNKYKA